MDTGNGDRLDRRVSSHHPSVEALTSTMSDMSIHPNAALDYSFYPTVPHPSYSSYPNQAAYYPQQSYEVPPFSIENMPGMPGYDNRGPLIRSAQTSPLNPSPPYPHQTSHQPFSRPNTVQTQSSFQGMWHTPQMSPVQGPNHFSPRQERPIMDGQMFYGPSTWTTPSSAYTFYTPYQPPVREQWSPAPSPAVPQTTWSSPQIRQNRQSWSGPSKGGEKERERKPYHPQAPARRSDHVMWVGNVPNNTSHEELWRYFNTTIPTTVDPNNGTWRGPSSIFLISRSSCAFVNLSSEEDLDRAVTFFNGRPLRPWDNRCPRMVCRVRRKDDDLRAGVGAQRGTGMHREWIKRQEGETLSPSAVEPPDGEGRRRESIINKVDHKSSGSCASTNSSFLLKHFPKRVFILKSLSTAELEDSVKTGTWRTQRHNEPILDQALRTSQEVFLIFGANRSGEFFGYAKMVEPIDKKAAAARPASHRSSNSSYGLKQSSVPGRIEEEEVQDRDRAGSEPVRPSFLSPSLSHITSSSPGELTPAPESPLGVSQHSDRVHARSAPDDITSMLSAQAAPLRAQTHETRPKRDYFQQPLPASSQDEADKQVAMGGSDRKQETDADGVLRKDTMLSPGEKEERRPEPEEEFGADEWGQTFRIQWVRVGTLPFIRTRHLRNPWNADREVKVSRDGTELEPGVGGQLMSEWDNTRLNTTNDAPYPAVC